MEGHPIAMPLFLLPPFWIAFIHFNRLQYNSCMHELAITESILNIAQKHGTQAQAAKVTDIYLVIGQLSSIIDDSVQFYWDIVSADTLCEGAKLHFQRISAEIVCQDCANRYTIEKRLTPCPICSSHNVQIAAGDEFFLESIEILHKSDIQE
jgi:hydrogenase nickel incorporation protein HypA/HybF